jgi:hypothetical protein
MKVALKAAGLLVLISLYGASVFGMTEESLRQTDIHGFISQGYLKSTDNVDFLSFGTADGTFEFNELGLNFSNEPAENLRVGMQFFAFDLGELGNDEIVLDWAYADYKIRDYFGLRAGLIRIPAEDQHLSADQYLHGAFPRSVLPIQRRLRLWRRVRAPVVPGIFRDGQHRTRRPTG